MKPICSIFVALAFPKKPMSFCGAVNAYDCFVADVAWPIVVGLCPSRFSTIPCTLVASLYTSPDTRFEPSKSLRSKQAPSSAGPA